MSTRNSNYRPGSASNALGGTLGRRRTAKNPPSIGRGKSAGGDFMLQGYSTGNDRDISVNTSPRFSENDSRFTFRPSTAPASKLLGSDSIWSLQQLAVAKPKTAKRRPKTATQLAQALRHKQSATGSGPRPPLRSARGRISPRNTYDFTNKVGVEDIPEDRPTFGDPLGAPSKGKFYSVRSGTGVGRKGRPSTAKAPINLEFKSAALEMEVELLQTLQERKARSEPPCPIRLEVFREMFAKVITKDKIFGAILERIKTEYEVFINPLESDSMKTLYESALTENDKLKDQYDALVASHSTLQKDAVQLSNENVRLRSALDEKTRENEDLKNDLAAENPLFMKQQAQAIRIRELEEDLRVHSIATENVDGGVGGNGTGGEEDYGDKTPEEIIAQLRAELELSRRRELASIEDVEILKEELAKALPDKYGKMYAARAKEGLSFEEEEAGLMGDGGDDGPNGGANSRTQERPMTVPPLRNLPDGAGEDETPR